MFLGAADFFLLTAMKSFGMTEHKFSLKQHVNEPIYLFNVVVPLVLINVTFCCTFCLVWVSLFPGLCHFP